MSQFTNMNYNRQNMDKLVLEIERQKVNKRDFIYPYSLLSYTDEGRFVFQGQNKGFDVGNRTFFDWNDAERFLDYARDCEWEGADDWKIEVQNETVPALPLNKTALRQLLFRLEVPGRFHTQLQSKGYSDVAGTLLRNLIDKQGEKRVMARTLDGRVRAIVSDRYKIRDNCDLFFASYEKIKDVGAELWQGRLWDDGFELFAAAPHISGEITTDRPPENGGFWRWQGEQGDVHNAACRIRNSETGNGGLGISLSILRGICINFHVFGDIVSEVHAGRPVQASDGLIKSDETRRLEAETTWSTIKDGVVTAFDETKFQELIAKLNNATEEVLTAEPEEVMDKMGEAYNITEERKSSILEELRRSGDNTRYGLSQAVTYAAHNAPPAEASELEKLGGDLIVDDKAFAAVVA